jgi:tripartite-type tricarboxylate transporter receptor subunit TctC
MNALQKTLARNLLAACFVAASSMALGQGYPSKPIHWILPFVPGGGTDVISRAFGPPLTAALGQPFIMENRPANAGLLAAEVVAKAAPDGYTILTGGNSLMMFNKLVYPKLSYDPERDFAPVTLLALAPIALFVHESVPSKSIKEFVAYSKTQGGKLNYGAAGVGHPFQLAMELLKQRTGLDVFFVPYKGSELVVQDLMGGRLQAMFYPPTEQLLSLVKAGRIRALAAVADKRLASMPNTPTFDESGVPNFEAAGWISLVTVAGTPRDIVMRLNREVVRISATPELAKVYTQMALVPATGAPEELAQRIKRDLAQWGPVVKSLGISLN